MPITLIPTNEDRHIHTKECKITHRSTLFLLQQYPSLYPRLTDMERQEHIYVFWNHILDSCTALDGAMFYNVTTGKGPIHRTDLEKMIRTYVEAPVDQSEVVLNAESRLGEFFRIREYMYLYSPPWYMLTGQDR